MLKSGLTHSWVVMQVFNIFNALGTIAFAYGGHNVVRKAETTLAYLSPMAFNILDRVILPSTLHFGQSNQGPQGLTQ